jgi:hypothetical protein
MVEALLDRGGSVGIIAHRIGQVPFGRSLGVRPLWVFRALTSSVQLRGPHLLHGGVEVAPRMRLALPGSRSHLTAGHGRDDDLVYRLRAQRAAGEVDDPLLDRGSGRRVGEEAVGRISGLLYRWASASTVSNALRAAMSTGSQTGANGGA